MTYHHPNPNHTYHFGREYQGLPILIAYGPFIREYLERLYQTMDRAMGQYPEVYAFRCDLRLPNGYILKELSYPNELIDRFIESFKAKIRHNRQMAFRENPYAHDTTVRYVWAREIGQDGHLHYHIVILLNKNAYCSVGRYDLGRDNMFNRLCKAWASALGLPVAMARSGVSVPEAPNYYLRYDNYSSIAKFFYRASYLCKAATKTFGDGAHGFGASRN